MLKLKVVNINAVLGSDVGGSITPSPYSNSGVSDKTIVTLKVIDSDKETDSLVNSIGSLTVEVPTIEAIPFKLGTIYTLTPEVSK